MGALNYSPSTLVLNALWKPISEQLNSKPNIPPQKKWNYIVIIPDGMVSQLQLLLSFSPKKSLKKENESGCYLKTIHWTLQDRSRKCWHQNLRNRICSLEKILDLVMEHFLKAWCTTNTFDGTKDSTVW